MFPRASLWNSLIDLWLAKDNRLLNPKSSYERILMAPTCRLIARASRRFHHPFQLLVLVPVCLSLSSLGFLFDRHDFPSFSFLSSTPPDLCSKRIYFLRAGGVKERNYSQGSHGHGVRKTWHLDNEPIIREMKGMPREVGTEGE